MTFLYVFRIHSSGADQQPLDTIGLVDAVLMSVTAQWIPVESSYEPVIANKLIGKCWPGLLPDTLQPGRE